MGLRIGTHLGALQALRSLDQAGRAEARTHERLSTGLRINRGSDDPSGLVLVEPIRAQLAAIEQASSNTQRAAGLISVADRALAETGDLLVRLRSNGVAALNSGVLGSETIRALQNSVDQGLRAIERIGATTRYGDAPLLNGKLEIQTSTPDPQLTKIDVQGGRFPAGFPVTEGVTVTAAATRAQAGGAISAAPQPSDSTVRVTGNRGMAEFAIAAGATQAEVIARFNAVREGTGIEADPSGTIRSIDYGSQATLNLQGSLAGVISDFSRGTDAAGSIGGAPAAGRGNTLEVNSNNLSAEVSVEPGVTGDFSFAILGGGARFQVGPAAGGEDDFTVGVSAVSTATLGGLSALSTGGANDLSRNPAGALAALDAAASEVSSLRGRLGSISGHVLEANRRALDTAFENLSASASSIRDADFAREAAAAVRNKLLKQAGLGVLRAANLNAGLALRLLS